MHCTSWWSYAQEKVFMMRGHARKIHSLSRMISESQRVWGPKTPPEIRAAGQAAFRNHDRLQVLFEQWTSCKGQWRESEFMISLKQKKRNLWNHPEVWGCRDRWTDDRRQNGWCSEGWSGEGQSWSTWKRHWGQFGVVLWGLEPIKLGRFKT